jgi:putative ABC transport system ATP-binding protein
VFALHHVQKSYSAGGTQFELLISTLEVARGAKLAIIGESGSGKSTLLELLAMILMPTRSQEFAFRPLADGEPSDVAAIWEDGRVDLLGELRSRHIGYVLQHGGLLPYLSVRENIELPRRLLELPVDDTADDLARKLGIEQQLEKRPAELSVGQRQRTAIARALAHNPPIVIADEPTAAIDPLNAEKIVGLLTELAEARGVTLILATHAQDLVRRTGFTLVPLAIRAMDEHTMAVEVGHA